MRLQLKGRTLELRDGQPLIMGIVNIGSDSVADPLSLDGFEAQLEFALRQSGAGAQIIDIGVQSGRTDTPILTEEQEIERLVPLVRALAERDVVVSVDTWRARVAEAAIVAGAALINDVGGLVEEALADVVGAAGAGLVVMHTRAAPKQARFPRYEDAMADILAFLDQRMRLAQSRGVARERIVLDPGLDYAKTPRESIEVLRRLGELRRFDRPILLAVSRKYFIGMLTGAPPDERLAGTLAAVEFGASAGAHIVRVHDVAQVAEFLRVRDALRGDGAPELEGDPDDETLKWLAPKGAVSG
ncbi:MAG TPA: dihydropteroate synthase [Solirubrobacteraceae bacterium]|jgi:dihydropteroate synthase|nr:dihydropteroate synthase [Solirubrobacteraceae bacterium]